MIATFETQRCVALMTREELQERFPGSELVFLGPGNRFDGCIIGVHELKYQTPRVVYDEKQVIAALSEAGNVDARDYFNAHIKSQCRKPGMPLFMNDEDGVTCGN